MKVAVIVFGVFGVCLAIILLKNRPRPSIHKTIGKACDEITKSFNK